MLFRRLFPLALILGVFGGLAVSAQSTHRGRKYKSPPPTTRVEITILRADDDKPIENAAVVFTVVGDKGNMELKTDEDGKTVLDVLPVGSKVLLQVLAKGYQTYGQDYTLDKSEMALEVRLNRPGHQYSVYEKHPGQAAQSGGGGKDSPSDTSKPDATKGNKGSTKADESSQSADPPGSKPDSNQPQRQ